MFSFAELAEMRAVAGQALPDTATIKRPTRTVDDAGGTSETLTTIASGAACRVAREKPREVSQAGKETILADWIVTLPYGTDIRADDVIETSGQTLRVVGLFTGSWRTCERVLCVA